MSGRLRLYFGRRRQGKSTKALSDALKENGGIVIYDINAQFRAFPRSTTSDLERFDQLVSEGDARIIVYRPQWSAWHEFGPVAQILRRLSGYTLLVDEASQLQKAVAAHPDLDWFVRMAPDGVRVFQTMHRPRDAATVCRSLATDWFIFRTTLRRDLEVIREQCGDEPAAAVARFREGGRDVYHWSDEFGRGEILSNPREWFVRK